MGTPEFAIPCLEYLYTTKHQIVAVITQPDRPKGRGKKMQSSPIKINAIERGVLVLQPEKINNENLVKEIRKLKPDLFITVAFGKFLSKEVLEIPPLGCINVHGSLLPKYRGAAPMQWALINGEVETGITTMYSDVGMDSGDMLLRDTLEIYENMNFKDLHDEMSILGAKTLKRTIEALENETLIPIKQNDDEATFANLKELKNKEIFRINWSKTSEEIHNLIRALDPYPGALTFYKGKRMKIHKSRYVENGQVSNKPGEIINISTCEMTVATGDGILNVSDIQMQNCRKMCIEECGHNLEIGEILE
jgi:methionyl-tRNA formyltransferase